MRYFTACACVFAVCVAGEDATLGTVLYKSSDLGKTEWSYVEQTDLRSRMVLESLVPSTVPDDGDVFLKYFHLLQSVASASIKTETGRKRAMLMAADAMGGYMYSRLLPRVRMLYYEGRLEYHTAKRLHDLMKKIKYVLRTDGRGWAKPAELRGGGHDAAAQTVMPPAERCGGVDAGPYGLGRDAEQPYFDDDAQPHSLVVPWSRGKYVLYSVEDAGCYRALFDHCVRRAAAADPEGRRALREWMRRTVTPLATPAAGRWYPALWGTLSVARRLETEAATGSFATDDGGAGAVSPNYNFYAALILAPQLIVWTTCLIVRYRLYDRCVPCLFEISGRTMSKMFDSNL